MEMMSGVRRLMNLSRNTMASIRNAFRQIVRQASPLTRLSVVQTPYRGRNVTPSLTRQWRTYATENVTAVEPPDYLDESERKIFDILKRELGPEKLEVHQRPEPTSS